MNMDMLNGFVAKSSAKAAKKSGIHIKPSHKGLLHKDLGVPAGKPIPAKKLAAAKKSKDPAVRKRATFAENAKHFNHVHIHIHPK